MSFGAGAANATYVISGAFAYWHDPQKALRRWWKLTEPVDMRLQHENGVVAVWEFTQ